MNREFNPTRRRLVLGGLATLGSLALPSGVLAISSVACQPEPQSGIQIETTPIVERGNLPTAGDIVVIDKDAFLLKKDERVIIPSTYIKNTKFEQYGGRVFTSGTDSFRRLPVRDPRATGNMLDWLASLTPDSKQGEMIREKIAKKIAGGGEMLLFFSGFITDDGIPYDPIVPRVDTFITFLKGLAGKGWEPWDAVHFNYGEKLWIDRYPLVNTTRDPKQNTRHAKQLVRDLKEELPLIKFNFIAHSLGGLFALHAAVEHPEVVNNLVLINSPIRGFDNGSAERITKAKALRAYLLARHGIDEKVTDYLFTLWQDKAYQKWVGDAVRYLRAIGKRVTVVIDENDGVVPSESARVPEVEPLMIKADVSRGLIPEAWDSLAIAHGRPLKDSGAIKYIGERIGNDLADAA